MKLLVFSHLFPSHLHVYQGCFVQEQLEALAQYHPVHPAVVSGYPMGLQTKSIGKFLRTFKAYVKELKQVQWVQEGNLEVLRFPYLINRQSLPFPVRAFCYTASVLCLFRKIRHSGPFDIIHSHTGFLDGLAGRVVSGILKRPLIITEHTGPFSTLTQHWLTRRVTLYSLASAQCIISVSPTLQSHIQAVLPVQAHTKMQVVPNGVDTQVFIPPLSVKAKSSIQLLSVLSLFENKNPFNVIRAFEQLKQNGYPVQLCIVGSGPLEEAVTTYIKASPLAQDIKLLPHEPRSEVMRLMRESCDVFVLPSNSETFGVVVIEAMACGKPVVSTRCGGPESILTQPYLGELCEVDNPESLAQAIEKVIQNPSDYPAEKIRQEAIERFDFKVIAQSLMDVYQSVIDAK